MSTPRYLRVAIETCRPCKTSTTHLRSRVPQSQTPRARDFSSHTPRCKTSKGPVDITSGFPTPELGSLKIPGAVVQESVKSEEKTDKVAASTSRTSTSPRQEKRAATAAQPRPKQSQKKPSPVPAEDQPSASPSNPPAEVEDDVPTKPNVPPNVLAAFRTPLYHPLVHGIPVASLQLRSFSARNLEFYADFCVRAAYYLGLPCTGPAPLPRKTERWTVLKSNFVNKTAQENFERITMKRLITVYDGEPSVVEVWLAFLRKWQYHGVGMKANVWQWEPTDVAGKMDRDFHSLEKELDDKLRLFGFSKHAMAARKTDYLLDLVQRQGHRHVGSVMSEVREKGRTTEDPWQ